MFHKKQFDKKVDLWYDQMKHGERDPYLIVDLEKNDETDVCSLEVIIWQFAYLRPLWLIWVSRVDGV